MVKMKRFFMKNVAVALAFAMFATMMDWTKVSAAVQEEKIQIAETVTFAEEEMEDNDALFAGYVQKTFLADADTSLFSTANHTKNLNADEKSIYEALKTAVAKIADGSEQSTQISIADWTKTFSYAQLGLNASSASEEVEAAVKQAFANSIDFHKIMVCLMADCPYEMYWYDKTKGSRYGYSCSYGNSTCTISSLQVKMNVASAYASAAYTTNTMLTGATKTAVENAREIVAENEGKTDYEKLVAYRNKICELVSYNEEAASNNAISYGDPWQLLYVFDGDANTNVVCEGYSKAFQYLCELSTFNGEVICYTVNGDIGGGHMWNHVTIAGKNYLVDVTNCDEGTIGAPDLLFLKGMQGDISSGYEKSLSGKITYQFSEETKEIFGTGQDSILNLCEEDYVEKIDAVQSVSVTASDESLTWHYKDSYATLTATPGLAAGITEKPQYQWYMVSDKNTETEILGATSETYTMKPGLSAGTYTYRVYVSIGDCRKKADIRVTINSLKLSASDLEFTSETITKKYDGTISSTAIVQIKAGVVADEPVCIDGTAEYNSPNVSEANMVTFTPAESITGNFHLTKAETISHKATIEKKQRTDTPGLPEVKEITETEITLKEVPGCEYAIVKNLVAVWQDSPCFLGLEENTKYLFYQRYKGDANTEPSENSSGEIATAEHKWVGGKITKEPTETKEGERTFTCSGCGKTKTETIEKKTAPTPQPPKKGNVVADDKAVAKIEVADVTKKEVIYKEPVNNNEKTVTIPATVKINGVTYKVIKIADNAFRDNKIITKVTIGSNIKIIGKNAFYKCTKLKTVKIGKNVTEIQANAFRGCTFLTSVTLGSKTTKIGANAFNGCKRLKTIKIPSTKLSSKTVAKNAFKGLSKVTTIKVPAKKTAAYKRLLKQKGLSSKAKVKGY